MRSIPIPRYFVFTLEDSTWVVQRGPDHVQELLTGKERSHSILDATYPITDVELELLMAQGIVDRYDEAYVWLRDTHHTEGMISMSALERPFGVTTHYYVEIGLATDQRAAVQDAIAELGLDNRYQASVLDGQVIILAASGEPFARLSTAEDAQFLLLPALEPFAAQAAVRTLRFEAGALPLPDEPSTRHAEYALIQALAPQIKGHVIVCVDDEHATHDVVREALLPWGVDVLSAYTGQEALVLIADADPTLILTDLKLPDMHGYEIVAHLRNNPDLTHIPLLIISSLDTETDRIFALSIAQAADYLTKPITGEELQRKVWRVLN